MKFIKKSRIVFLSLILMHMVACTCGGVIPPQDIQPGEVSITVPKVEKWELENGLEVVYYHRPELPLVSGSLYIPKGSLSNDTGIPALSSVLVKQMREGGIKGYKPDDFDSLLDMKAAAIEAGIDDEVTTFSFSSLSEDFNEVTAYFSSIVQQPYFSEERLTLWKKLSKEGIKRRKDSPDTMGMMLFSQVSYGKDSPRYIPVSEQSIEKISIPVLREMHRRLFVPEGAVLVLVGNLELPEVKLKISNEFSGWKKDASANALPRFAASFDNHQKPKGIYVIESDFEQANIILGHKGSPRNKETVFKEVFLNRVLGSSGFGSLLFKEIRERRGLVYSIGGGFNSSITEGSFTVSMGTKADSALKAVQTTYELLEQVKEGYLPEEQVESTRSATTKNFVFKFEDPAYAAQRPVLLKMYDFPNDYDTSFVESINSISRNDLIAYAKEELKPEALFTIIVGKVSAKDIKQKVGETVPVCKVTFVQEPEIEACW